MITIALAEDHGVVREGLRALLTAQADFQVVGECSDGLAVVPLVRKLAPQVLLLDLMMPGLNGLDVTRQVAKTCPGTRIMILSMHANEAYVVEALRSGATGYVVKDASGPELIEAVREVAAGRTYLSRPFSAKSIELSERTSQASEADPYDALTAREREIFQLAAEGFTSPQIGQRLFISSRTVETHRAHLMRKLGLRSQTELVRLAVKRGLLLEPS